jgi:outer membrane protein OmpA-like peptidoglycan-associated protein
MLSRLLAIVQSKAFIIAALLLGLYALAGFVLAPVLVSRYLPRYVDAQFKRQASIGEVRVNPFLLQLDARDFALKEMDGRPIAGFRRLFVDLELESLWRWAWTLENILLEAPSVLVDIAPDGRVNLAALRGSQPKPQPPPERDRNAPRLLLHHLVLSDGRFAFSDRVRRTPAEATLQPVNIELHNVSTLPDQQAPYLLKAQVAGGGSFAWDGELSLQPLHSAGKFEVTGLKPAALWSFVQHRFDLVEPAGTLDARASYEFTHTDEGVQLALKDVGAAVTGIALANQGAAEPVLALDTVRLLDGRLDLATREASFGALEIGPGRVRADRDASGTINWQKLIRSEPASPSQNNPGPPAAPWKLSLSALRIHDVGLHYQDASRATPIRLEVEKFGLDLALALETRADGLVGAIRDAKLGLTGITFAERDRSAPLARLDKLDASNLRLDLAAREVTGGSVTLGGGAISVERDKDGRIHSLDALRPAHSDAPTRDASKADKASGRPWSLAVESAAIENFAMTAADRSMDPGAAISVFVKRIALANLRNDGKTPMNFSAAVEIKEGGAINAEGRINASGRDIDGNVKVAALNLAPLKPYVSRFTTLQLGSGKVSTAGRFSYKNEGPKPSVRYDGTLNVSSLLLNEARTRQRFLSWRSLSAEGMTFGLAPDRLDIAEVRVLEPGAKIVISKDRRINLTEVIKPRAAAERKARARGEPIHAGTSRGKPRRGGAQFPVTIKKVRLEKGEVDFADFSLVLPFATRVWDFKGSTSGISSAPASRTKLQFEGRVDDYGLAKVSGSLQPLEPKNFTDVTVIFRNVEMARLSPYSVTFAGRKIASGKLNLDLEYKMNKSQLTGENKVLLEKFTLGERVEAPNALDLPLDLAVALLTDSQGRIDIAVPVSGNVDQPEFSYGKVMWNAFTSLITRVVTAPFRALGGLFGGKEDQSIDALLFEPGSAELPPPEQEKLKKASDLLKQRPRLKLVVQGRYDEQRDGKALREKRVRQALAEKLGVRTAANGDPDPLAFDDAKTQRALESLLEERGGANALTGLKTEYEKSIGREAKRVNPALALIGRASPDTGLYEAMFERLTELTPLPPAELAELAQSRAEAMRKTLVELGAESARLATSNPAPAERSDAQAVASTLKLDAIETGA